MAATAITIPDTSIDLTPYRINIGDTLEYITKHGNWQTELESWSLKLMSIANLFKAYLEEAQNIPDALRVQLQQLVADAQASEAAMRNLLASASWPELPDSPAGYMFRVKSDGSGYEAVPPSALTTDIAQDIADELQAALDQINAIRAQWDVAAMPAGSLARVVVDPATGERSFAPVSIAELLRDMHRTVAYDDTTEGAVINHLLPDNPIDDQRETITFLIPANELDVTITAGQNGSILGYESMKLDLPTLSVTLVFKNGQWRAG